METSSQMMKALCWPCCGQNHLSYNHFLMSHQFLISSYKYYISISEQYIFESTAGTVQAQLQFVPTRLKKWGYKFSGPPFSKIVQFLAFETAFSCQL
jgi:hypothetical protein